MAWNKHTCLPGQLFKVVLAVIFLALLGCEQNPTKKEEGKPSIKPEALATDPSGKIAKIIPNPYLENAGDAPAAAKTEFVRIQSMIKNGRMNEAVSALTKMRQDYPKLSGPAVNLGLVYWKQKNYAQAGQYFETAQTINKYNPDAYTQFAVMLREQGKFSEAEAQYLKALTVWPHNPQAHRDLGVLYDLYLVQPEKALQHFTMCDQLSSEPNKEIKGWILELNRRLNKKPEKSADAKLEGAP